LEISWCCSRHGNDLAQCCTVFLCKLFLSLGFARSCKLGTFTQLTHVIHIRLDVGAPGSVFADYLRRCIYHLAARKASIARVSMPSARHFLLLRERLTTFAGRPDTMPSTCKAQRSNAARFSSA